MAFNGFELQTWGVASQLVNMCHTFPPRSQWDLQALPPFPGTLCCFF